MTGRLQRALVSLAWAAVFAGSTVTAGRQTRDVAGLLPAGTAAVSGTVVTDETPARPVRRAVLTLTGGGERVGRQTVTDDEGHFTLTGLRAGGYTLSAAKAGWVTTYYGSRHPGERAYGTPLVLGEGAHQADVTLRLLRGGALTGTILDPSGRPAAADVRLWQYRVSAGTRTLVPASAHGSGATDDRGVYRFFGLAPGDYVVAASGTSLRLTDGSASVHQVTADVVQGALGTNPTRPTTSVPSAGPTVGFTDVYYPGTVDPTGAAAVTVGPGEEKAGIDFSLVLVPTASIRATVAEPDGTPVVGARAFLLSAPAGASDDAGASPLARARLVGALSDGTLTVASVPPGRYVLLVRATDRPAAPAAGGTSGVRVAGPFTRWAEEDVSVDGRDIAGLRLVLQPGMTVIGHVTVDRAGEAPADLAAWVVSLEAAESQFGLSVPPAPVSADGSFRLAGVVPGRYRLNVQPGRGAGPSGGSASWEVASVLVGGRDAIDRPVELAPGESVTGVAVVLTPALGQITGTLADAAGRPAAGYLLVALSADRAYWSAANRRMPMPTTTGPDGAFQFARLPAGEYILAVATDVETADLQDPAALESLAAEGLHVTVRNGDRTVQNVRIAAGAPHRP